MGIELEFGISMGSTALSEIANHRKEGTMSIIRVILVGAVALAGSTISIKSNRVAVVI